MPNKIAIEVVYALPDEQCLLAAEVPENCSAKEAVILSGILDKHPQIDVESMKLGIFGKLIKPDAALREGDRIEILRPLIADPKEIRRKRAEEGKVMKKGGA